MPPEEDSPSRPLSVLVVEDDSDTRKMIKAYLVDCGYAVSEAATMNGGLAALEKGHFDVLLSDIGLPDGNGWDLLQTAPAGSASLAIAMSGFGQGSDRSKSESAGFQHHLLKPFDPGELTDILQKFAHAA